MHCGTLGVRQRQNHHVADVGPARGVHAAHDPARLVETVTAEEEFAVEFVSLRELCEFHREAIKSATQRQ